MWPRAVKLRTPVHDSPLPPRFTWSSQENSSGSVLSSQYAIRPLPPSSRLDLYLRTNVDQRPDLLDLCIGHRDTAVGPIAGEVESPEPAEAIRQTMDHNVTSGRDTTPLCVVAIGGAWIRNPQRQVKAAARVLEIDRIRTFGRTAVTFALFVTQRIAAERGLVDRQNFFITQQCQAARRLLHN